MDDRHDRRPDGDTFLGYVLARIETRLETIERKVNRVENAIDTLGPMTGHPEILTRLDALKAQGEQIMGTIQLAREALSALNTTTNTMAEAVASVVAADDAEDAAFKAEIQALKDQMAAGEAVTAADLEELTVGMGGTHNTLVAVKEALLAMGASPTDPIPPVVIPPVEPPVA